MMKLRIAVIAKNENGLNNRTQQAVSFACCSQRPTILPAVVFCSR